MLVPVQIPAAPGRWLAAVHHPPAAVPTGRAVLVIHPLGQEAVRAHRLLRVLSDRLARQGAHVLRFDFHGCGDSSGDDLEGEMVGWRDDLLAAHQWLQQQPAIEGVAWLGVRLGFAVGWQAAQALAAGQGPVTPPLPAVSGQTPADLARSLPSAPEALRPPDRLIGWDPVVAGQAYLEALWADHQRALWAAFSLPTVPARQLRRQRAEEALSEAMGFGLSPRLVAQIRDLDQQDWTSMPIGDVRVLLSNAALPWPEAMRPAATEASVAGRPAPRQAPAVRLEHVDVDFDWTSEEALNTPLVPDLALRQLLPWLLEGSSTDA